MKAKQITWIIILSLFIAQVIFLAWILAKYSENLFFDLPILVLCGAALLYAFKQLTDTIK